MLCAFPFHEGDALLLRSLLLWIRDLGGCKEHEAVLVADASTDWGTSSDCLKLAKAGFKRAWLINNDAPVKGWIPGSNSLFLTAARFAKQRNVPFFFCEPDGIPLKASWLSDIETRYNQMGKEWMGPVVHHHQSNFPNPYLEGCSVYPARAIDVYEKFILPNRSWTHTVGGAVLPNTHHTNLIQHLWGQPNASPSFVEHKTPAMPPFTMELDGISKEAVFFHRCKDGSLIQLLRRRLLPSFEDKSFVVVWPFFRGDVSSLIRTLKWVEKLGTPRTHDALLVYDRETPSDLVATARTVAGKAFRSAGMQPYQTPRKGVWAPNAGFWAGARHCQAVNRNFLWMEHDAIPMKPDWLDVLGREYEYCKKPFMGPVIEGMGHMNGTGMYPYNTPLFIPRTMNKPDGAWDCNMKPEMIQHCHPCNHIFQHAWGVVDGKLHQSSGPAASFPSRKHVEQWIDPNAVVFHRCKDGTLIQRLTEMLPSPQPELAL